MNESSIRRCMAQCLQGDGNKTRAKRQLHITLIANAELFYYPRPHSSQQQASRRAVPVIRAPRAEATTTANRRKDWRVVFVFATSQNPSPFLPSLLQFTMQLGCFCVVSQGGILIAVVVAVAVLLNLKRPCCQFHCSFKAAR